VPALLPIPTFRRLAISQKTKLRAAAVETLLEHICSKAL
jgi:hypothetical protein